GAHAHGCAGRHAGVHESGAVHLRRGGGRIGPVLAGGRRVRDATGGPPFTGATVAVLHAHVHEQPRAIRDLRPDCPESLASVVERMLAKRPEDRYPDLAAALSALGAQPVAPSDPFRAELVALATPVQAGAGPQPVALGPGSEVEIVPAREALVPGEWVDVAVRVDGQDSGELRGWMVWRTSDPSIAQVTAEGQVRALRPGSVVITASAGQWTASARLTVAEPAPGVGVATPPPGVPGGGGLGAIEDAGAAPVGATALFESDPGMEQTGGAWAGADRKSTRLNSSHVKSS